MAELINTEKQARATEPVRIRFHYDPETGYLYHRDWSHLCTNPGNVAQIRKRAGTRADTPAPGGYRRITIRLPGDSQATTFYAHRVGWFLYHGRWPIHLDHIDNTNRSDNRLCNLREYTHQQNMTNMKNNTAHPGVRRHSNGRSWRACWTEPGKRSEQSKTFADSTYADHPYPIAEAWAQAVRHRDKMASLHYRRAA